jgi:hypothetical protein
MVVLMKYNLTIRSEKSSASTNGQVCIVASLSTKTNIHLVIEDGKTNTNINAYCDQDCERIVIYQKSVGEPFKIGSSNDSIDSI